MNRFILLAALVASAPAFAQNPQQAAPTNPTVPMAPSNAPSPPPEKLAPSSHSGTITPPNVDPGMAVAPTRTGAASTPVIPPPGTPGGNQSVVPK